MFRVEDDDSESSSSLASSHQDEDSSPTLVEALERKYLCDEDVDSSILLTTSVSPCKLASEYALALLVLDHKRISSIGDIDRFNKLARNIVEADLSFNQLSDWSEIATILRLPRLTILNIAFNPLKDSINVNLPVAQRLQACYLNGNNLSLSTLRVLLGSMPELRELYLSHNLNIKNGIGDDGPETPISVTVRTLHVIKCDISDWNIAVLLRRLFPSCQYLVLCENPIREIAFSENLEDQEAFKGLHYLSLSRCDIDDWAAIESLADIETLRAMKLQQIPLLSKYSEEERFHLVVGRLPFLQELNGSTITEDNRITSERFFIRYYDVRETKPKIFSDLILRHGHVEQLCPIDMTPKKHINVVVNCEEKGYKATIRIPRTHSVLAFKRTLEKRLNIPVHQMRLFYLGAADSEYVAEELRLPSSKLSSLRVEDGDQFSVQSKITITRRTTSANRK